MLMPFVSSVAHSSTLDWPVYSAGISTTVVKLPAPSVTTGFCITRGWYWPLSPCSLILRMRFGDQLDPLKVTFTPAGPLNGLTLADGCGTILTVPGACALRL